MTQKYVRVTKGGKRIQRSHEVWDEKHPEDPVKEGEVVHHKDKNKHNDVPDNLEKKLDPVHRSEEMKLVRKLRGPVKTSPESCSRGAAGMRKYFEEHPEEYEQLKEKRREGVIRANKARRLPVWEFNSRRAAYMRKYRKSKEGG